jgi:hypothetical protein
MSSRTQNQIDVERDAMGILRLLVLWREVSNIRWTREAIEEWTGVDGSRLSSALEWLVEREYCQVSTSGQYTRTTDGERAYGVAARHGRFRSNWGAWKDEALTGLVSGGRPGACSDSPGDWQRSKLTRAALPRGSEMRSGVVAPDPAYIMSISERRRAIADELGVTMDELHEGIRDGSIRKCPVCGKTGQFHENQSACITCRKTRRK